MARLKRILSKGSRSRSGEEVRGTAIRWKCPSWRKSLSTWALARRSRNVKILDIAVSELSMITGQRPVITKAKKSIATFKLRQGMSIGCRVTLRKDRMYEFYDRLVNVNLPRVRDFRGIPPKSFDGRGKFCPGVSKSRLSFPRSTMTRSIRSEAMNIVVGDVRKKRMTRRESC